MTEPFNAEEIVWRYRYAHDTKDTTECERLLNVWKERQGEDSLHEMAFGKPIEREALDERINKLIDRQHRAVQRFPPELCEMEWPAGWPDTWGFIRRYELRKFENADTRESQAITKELRWVFFRARRFLPQDAPE